MQNKELIEKLQECDLEAEVKILLVGAKIADAFSGFKSVYDFEIELVKQIKVSGEDVVGIG